MARRPLILITPSIESQGVEFQDLSSSLSLRYEWAVEAAGGLPMVAPATTDEGVLAEALAHADGLLLTGGDDINPRLYDGCHEKKPSRKALATVGQTPDGGARDLRELVLIREGFRQKKAMLAICRGHQMLQVAFGGPLVVDIRQQVKGALNHQRMDRPLEAVHEAQLTPGSLLSKICRSQVLGVNSTHHQAVVKPVWPLVASAVSRDGVVEAMELGLDPGLPFFLSVQFHPERLMERNGRHLEIFERFVAASRGTIKQT